MSRAKQRRRWITPSIFQTDNGDGSIVDEWTLCKNNPNAESILRKHWDSWVCQDDFQKIADAGFNTVRIPVGCKLLTRPDLVRFFADISGRLGIPEV